MLRKVRERGMKVEEVLLRKKREAIHWRVLGVKAWSKAMARKPRAILELEPLVLRLEIIYLYSNIPRFPAHHRYMGGPDFDLRLRASEGRASGWGTYRSEWA